MKSRLLFGGLLAGAMLVAGVFAGTVFADYPPPNGNVTATLSATTVAAGQSVVVTAVVRDAESNAVAGAPCTMSIASQPGSGASITPDSTATDANGVITGTLTVGLTAGNVVVRVECPTGPSASEVLSASVTSVVEGGAAEPPGSIAEPPGSIASPTTGTGGEASSSRTALVIAVTVVVLAAGASLLGLSLLGQARRRRRER